MPEDISIDAKRRNSQYFTILIKNEQRKREQEKKEMKRKIDEMKLKSITDAAQSIAILHINRLFF